MTVSVITPTCDRPVGFALAERWMARQTRQPDEWIVADGGSLPVTCTQGQTHIHRPTPAGALNLARNLLAGLDAARGDYVVIWEDDDWYAPTHLAQLLAQLEERPERPDVWAAGSDRQRYYNLVHRVWRIFPNHGACLCQTGMTRAAVPTFRLIIERCLQAESYGIDGRFWSAVPRAHWNIQPLLTCVGIKGLPGSAGLGIGHRPTLRDRRWKPDPHSRTLRDWVGDDAGIYLNIYSDLPA